jgi:hypothetical protein
MSDTLNAVESILGMPPRKHFERTDLDHIGKALRNVEGLHDYQSEEGISDESMLTVAIEAQVHATLALAEQQRIANLIAFQRSFPNSPKATEAIRAEIERGVGLL